MRIFGMIIVASAFTCSATWSEEAPVSAERPGPIGGSPPIYGRPGELDAHHQQEMQAAQTEKKLQDEQIEKERKMEAKIREEIKRNESAAAVSRQEADTKINNIKNLKKIFRSPW